MDARSLIPEETVPASRKLGREDALRLARHAERLVVAKGKRVSEFRVGARVTDEAVAAMLGPTGNLRAPTIRTGATLVVGFDEDSYAELLG